LGVNVAFLESKNFLIAKVSDQHHDQTLPEPAVLGADLAEPISIA
jgi:hypothetical protein